MKVVKAKAEIIPLFEEDFEDNTIFHLEICARMCYQSETTGRYKDAENLLRTCIARGHESVIEHVSISARFVCDRGVSHEIVRHRLASYSQESTRYCNYSGKDVSFILPCWFGKEFADWLLEQESITDTWFVRNLCTELGIAYTELEMEWLNQMVCAEKSYHTLIEGGWQAERARAVLPNSLKTELVMTANLREWRHFFKLRCGMLAHPQMREVATELLGHFRLSVPVLFDDIQGFDEYGNLAVERLEKK